MKLLFVFVIVDIMDTKVLEATNTLKNVLCVKEEAQKTLEKLNKIEKEFTKDNFVDNLHTVKALVKSLEIRVFQAFEAMAKDLMEHTK